MLCAGSFNHMGFRRFCAYLQGLAASAVKCVPITKAVVSVHHKAAPLCRMHIVVRQNIIGRCSCFAVREHICADVIRQRLCQRDRRFIAVSGNGSDRRFIIEIAEVQILESECMPRLHNFDCNRTLHDSPAAVDAFDIKHIVMHIQNIITAEAQIAVVKPEIPV